MRILIIGASRGTGALCVQTALARGHSVTAFARTPERLAVTDRSLTKVRGDVHDPASVASAVAGHDAVITCVGIKNLLEFRQRRDFFSSGTRHCIDAMREHGVRRLVVLSAFGVGDSGAFAPWYWPPLVINGLLKIPFADHAVEESMVRESGLEYVIARPTRLTNGPATPTYTATTGFDVPLSISRADVADFLVKGCESDEFLGRDVNLGG